jgi:hypothetical protein
MIHNFDFKDNVNPKKQDIQQFNPVNGDGLPELVPQVAQLPFAPLQGENTARILYDNTNIDFSSEVREILPQGFRTTDRGIKNYFSGIRVPTKDDIKIMQVRISGGDKPYLIWAQDITRGRITLPVMSIKRESGEHFIEKWSPANYHYFTKRFADAECSKIILSYRPIPVKISYSLSVWAEHKRDLEYIQFQILSRFNPLAEFKVEDEYMRATIILHYEGTTISVDDEVPADQRANKRHDYKVLCESYLPLATRIVPSILGRAIVLKDGEKSFGGEVLQVVSSAAKV